MRSPVLFQVFNRPEVVRQTFAAIRAARPPRLYVAADGPRDDKPGEAALCAEVRRLALAVDWPCQVHTLFNEKNMGLPKAVESAYSWFFSHEAEGVVLEEDVLAHPDFFPFCDALLERYRHEPRIFCINGGTCQMGRARGEGSYYFSIFPHSWGWASWARAWKHYDPAMTGCLSFMQEEYPARGGDPQVARFFLRSFAESLPGATSTWDNQWTYAVFRNNGLCAVPNKNLTVNLGFENGTHFTSPPIWKYLELEAMPHIVHPAAVRADVEADRFHFETAHLGINFFSLVEEGYRRLDAGLASANHELIRLLRLFFADNSELSKLEILSFLNENRIPEALEALARAQAAHDHAKESFALIAAQLRRFIKK